MSTYSDQIDLVVKTRLLPKMEALGEEIARIEPYSYSSSILEEYKRQLDYYSMVYDFLYEYITGEEELEGSKLVNIVRLIEANERRRKSADFLELTTPVLPGSKVAGVELYIDKLKVSETMVLDTGTATLTVVYTPAFQLPDEVYIMVELDDGTTAISEGTICSLQNITLSGSSVSVTVTVYSPESQLFTQTFSLPVHYAGIA